MSYVLIAQKLLKGKKNLPFDKLVLEHQQWFPKSIPPENVIGAIIYKRDFIVHRKAVITDL